MADLLTVRNLQIQATSYPPGEPPKTVTLVDGVSFALRKGKVLGLIGESGAGKSTIGLAALAYGRGGVRITGGEVILSSQDILKLDHRGIRGVRGTQVCYVAQSAAVAFNPAHRLGDQVIEASLRHASIAPCRPDSSTSGTSSPRKLAGRVYCGCCSRPSTNVSPRTESPAPTTPGTSRDTASMITRAGISPPVRT